MKVELTGSVLPLPPLQWDYKGGLLHLDFPMGAGN